MEIILKSKSKNFKFTSHEIMHMAIAIDRSVTNFLDSENADEILSYNGNVNATKLLKFWHNERVEILRKLNKVYDHYKVGDLLKVKEMAITVSQGGDMADTFLLDSAYSTFKYDRECCDGERLSDKVKAELQSGIERDLDDLMDEHRNLINATKSIKWLTKTLIHRIKNKILRRNHD